MIDEEKYAIEAIKILNELKNSLDINQRKQIEDDLVKDFISQNFKEICKFIESTPKKRLSIKKWQKDYSLYIYSSYLMLLQTLNEQILTRLNFNPIMSYRADLSALISASFESPYIESMFIEDENHYFEQIHGY